MKVGITGTREGMTPEQKAAFGRLFTELRPTVFGHGDCVGVDDEAARLVDECDVAIAVHVICYPPVDETHRAFNPCYDEMRAPRTHFARNRDIVDECDVLIVVPLQNERQDRGGTWYTHDYAVKKGKPLYVLWPDGRVQPPKEAS